MAGQNGSEGGEKSNMGEVKRRGHLEENHSQDKTPQSAQKRKKKRGDETVWVVIFNITA